jgi:cholesterol transport system auxiliary component
MIQLRSCLVINYSHPDRENSPVSARLLTFIALVACLVMLSGCAVLPGSQPVRIDKYVLEYNPVESSSGSETELPVMIITVPRAHGGYDTSRIAYRKQQFGLLYYSKSRWADTPARMLAPLLAEAMTDTGEFRALSVSPGSLSARYRLDSELIHFYQDFTVQPSEVRIMLRAQLVSLVDNQVLASRLFDVREASLSEDAYGGVQAANRASGRLLVELAQFCKTRTDR